MNSNTKPYAPYHVAPALESAADAWFSLGGVVNDRARACIDSWLLPAPEANPALTEIFYDRYRSPDRELVPWAGEFVGKHLISSVGLWRLTRDSGVMEMIEETIGRILAAQGDDGYLGPFSMDVRLQDKWDVWGHYHIMLGLLDYADVQPGVLADRGIDACLRIVRLMDEYFVKGDRRMINDSDADGEKNHAVAHAVLRLHRRTGDEVSLSLVRWIEEQWEEPPAGQYVSSALAGMPVSKFPAHRWESVHDWQAIGELYLHTGDEKYRKVFEHIWWSILEGDRHNTGGFTSGEACQGNPYDGGAIETCCTMAWMAMSVDMLRITGSSRVADEIELSMLNGMIGGQHPSGRWWTYNTPMNGMKKASAHDIVFQSRAGSPELNCCSVNAPRGIGMLASWAMMERADGAVAVNWYGPGVTEIRTKSGVPVRFSIESEYPLNDTVSIEVDTAAPQQFRLLLRIPEWSKDTTVAVNGETLPAPAPGEYFAIDRTWEAGDTVQLGLDFSPHVWVGDQECAGTISIYRGPILLTYDMRYDSYAPDELPTLDVTSLSVVPVPANEWMAPWLLVQAGDGKHEVTLCDFASAGSTGSHYRSWLPATGMEAIGFERESSIWARR